MIPIRNHHQPEYFPVVTIAIILANIWVFWYQMTLQNLTEFVMTWALVLDLIDFDHPESMITFITSQFLHAGFLHLGFNMWFLWIFGPNIESRFGHVRFLLFYIAAGIAAALLQLVFITDPTTPMLGASGAVAGVLGAYLIHFSHHRIDMIVPLILWIPLVLPAGFVLFLWFFTQLFSGAAALVQDAATTGVAWWAHVGGFVFGMLIATLLYNREDTSALS